ncbi:hypothetical protein Tco_1048679 [Tanacetum coccineum]
MTHPSPKRNMVPKAVLMRSGLVSLTTARPVNTAQPRSTVNSARPMTNVFNKAHLTVRRPINNSDFNKRVNAISGKNVNTAKVQKALVNADTAKSNPIITDFEEIDGGYEALEVTQNMKITAKSSPNDGFKPSGDDEKKITEEPRKEGGDVTPRLGGNTRRNIMDIITTQWCQQ